MRAFALVLVLIALLLSIGCAKPTPVAVEPTATPVPAAAPATATPTAAPVEPPAAAVATPTIEAIVLPTPVAPDMAELRAKALDNLAIAFDALALPDVPVAATVNGEDIDMARFMDYLRLRLYSITMQNEVDWSDPQFQTYLPDIAKEVLDVRIQSLVMWQQARKLDMMPSQADIDEYRVQLIANLMNAEQLDSEAALLAAYGVSADAITDIVTDTLTAQMLYNLEAKIAEEEQVKARHILVGTQEEADAVIARLDAGEDFGTLAQELSLDTGSGAQGGDLGWFPRGAMVPTFEEAAFALEPGEMSTAVQSQFGFHIILVEDKGIRPLDAAMAQARQQQAFDERLAALQAESTVERFVLTD